MPTHTDKKRRAIIEALAPTAPLRFAIRLGSRSASMPTFKEVKSQ